MSPIMIRPVKEQIEHDRVIRVLDQLFRAKYFAVESNVGDDRKASYKTPTQTHYPDVVLTAPSAPKKMLALVEVESGESVNKLEAMAQWAHYGRAKAVFQLYVPSMSIDVARRIIEDHQIAVTELWSYVAVGDDIHFHLVAHATKSFDANVRPGDTMPAMPVYVPPPPAPEKPAKVTKSTKRSDEDAPAETEIPASAPPKPGSPSRAAKADATAKPVKATSTTKPSKPAVAAPPKASPKASDSSMRKAAPAAKATKAAKPAKPATTAKKTAAKRPAKVTKPTRKAPAKKAPARKATPAKAKTVATKKAARPTRPAAQKHK